MDTAVVGSRPAESVLTNSGGRRRSSRTEANATVRSPIEWADDDPDREGPTARQESLSMIGSHRNAPHES